MSELEWLDIFANNLVYWMNQMGMNQRDLAEATGLSEATISNYIRKRQFPGIKAIINMANVFGCSMDDFIDFGDVIH